MFTFHSSFGDFQTSLLRKKSFYFEKKLQHRLLKNPNNESAAESGRSVFYRCLESRRPSQAGSGGVVFHRPVWYVCAPRPTQTHLTADWLAFLPCSVIMAPLQASPLCLSLCRMSPASAAGTDSSPVPLANRRTLTIAHH